MYQFIEACQTLGEQECDTEEYFPGRVYDFQWNPDWAVRLIFENDDKEDAVFQIQYQSAAGDTLILGGQQIYSALSIATLSLFYIASYTL